MIHDGVGYESFRSFFRLQSASMAESPLGTAACRILRRGHHMSLHPQEPPSVPEETSRVARAAFPKGSLCLHIADELGSFRTRKEVVPPSERYRAHRALYGIRIDFDASV